jgi:hypothetical protein
MVSGWAWHLEMKPVVTEHRGHGEHGGWNLHEDSADGHALARRCRVGIDGFCPIRVGLAAPPGLDLAGLSFRAATDEEAAPRSCYSTA